MEARINLLKDLSRMCRNTSCVRCPIHRIKEEKPYEPCLEIIGDCPEEVINAVEKWTKEHPKKTLLDDVKEKYPNIALADDGFPEMCPSVLGYFTVETEDECKGKSCFECWKQPLNK